MLIKKNLISNLISDLSSSLASNHAPGQEIYADHQISEILQAQITEKQALIAQDIQDIELVYQSIESLQAQLQAEQSIYAKQVEDLNIQQNNLQLQVEKFAEYESDILAQINTLNHQAETIIQNNQDLILDIVVMLTEKLIMRQIHQSPGILQSLIDEGLSYFRSADGRSINLIFLTVNPEDYDIALQYAQTLMDKRSADIEIKVKIDENIMQGSCILESDNGAINLDFKNQLSIFRQKVIGGNLHE